MRVATTCHDLMGLSCGLSYRNGTQSPGLIFHRYFNVRRAILPSSWDAKGLHWGLGSKFDLTSAIHMILYCIPSHKCNKPDAL